MMRAIGKMTLPVTTTSRRIRWLELKRTSSYQVGEVATLATKRKATADFDPGMSCASLDILSLLSDNTLLAIAHM